ncbi:MAG: B12-binding domain-containing radical SAM protein [Armatimonadetes bacterium]|nr:B12-binding domain-containing radical SAM protein [Armatimonadota bacterium]
MKLGLLDVQNPDKKVENFNIPLGLLYLAGYLRKHVPEVSVFVTDRLDSLLAYGPDVIGVTAMTPNYKMALDTAIFLKDRTSVPILLGGAHITALPHTLAHPFDIGVFGEGEATLLELVRIYLSEGGFAKESLTDTQGITYHKNGSVCVNSARPLIAPLDEIPPPLWDLWNLGARVKWMSTSRGCPYSCNFCFKMLKHYRSFSPAYIVNQLKEVLTRYPSRSVYFVDDLFAVDRKRLAELGPMMQKEGLTRNVSYICTVRADLVTEEMASLMWEAGVRVVHLGLESGSDKILSYLKNETTTVEENQRALEICYDKAFFTFGSFIIGTPGETEQDLDATYEFIKRNWELCRIRGVGMSPLIVLPGTHVWADALSRGLVSEDMEWDRLDMDMMFFDPDRYVYLNPDMKKETFLTYFEKFKDLFWAINKKFGHSVIPEPKAKTTQKVQLPEGHFPWKGKSS